MVNRFVDRTYERFLTLFGVVFVEPFSKSFQSSVPSSAVQVMFLMPGASIPAYGTCRTRLQDILSMRVSDSVFLVHARLEIEA
jgi:hypothetical protein